ncbi:hypothetical protein V0M98_34390 (plasmid) [Pseudomonas silesiensis]|uniref:hypothetical protein n=1 Tax=Pseudomonas silesiensis TaxID=1853130 RepID=UPI0030CA646D
MKVISTDMAAALKHLIETMDLSAAQIEGEDWTDAACTARDALPEGTVEALGKHAKVSIEAFGITADSAAILELATDCVERGLEDEALLHLGILATKLSQLKGLLTPNIKAN